MVGKEEKVEKECKDPVLFCSDLSDRGLRLHELLVTRAVCRARILRSSAGVTGHLGPRLQELDLGQKGADWQGAAGV